MVKAKDITAGPDVVLFNPSPWTGLSLYKRRVLPLSLMHLAPPLERLGYSVAIIDQFSDSLWKRKLKFALQKKPACFGVTSMTGPQILQAVEACRWVKSKYPDVPVVWGGIHATIKPSQVLENPNVDVVVIGEGEETFAELVGALENGARLGSVKGIAYKENGKILFTESRPFIDLNDYPAPAYHLVDMDRYQEQILGREHVHIICSRGCIYDCAYCWDPVFHQRKYRSMEPENVLGLIERLNRDHGKTGVIFGDDNFFIDLDWARKVLEGIVRSGLDVHIGKQFIRADTLCRLDKDFLGLLVKAGVRRFVIGAESGSPRILRLIKKRITVEEIIEANRNLVGSEIQPAFLFMMGLPTETPEEVGESLKLADRLMNENPDATRAFNNYTPFPGTELYEMILRMGFKEPENLEDWASMDYRSMSGETPWILPETKKLTSVLDYALMCSDRDNSLGGVKKADPLSVWMAKAYGPLARYRVRTMDTRFPIEPLLIKALRRVIGRDRG